METGLGDDELDAIESRCTRASAGPWRAYVEGRDHYSGDSFIMIGTDADRAEDMYVSRDSGPGSEADLEFIAAARQDIPRLLAEIRRLQRGQPQA